MKTVIVYAQSSPSNMEPYLEKLSQVFDSIGVEYTYLLWSRGCKKDTLHRKVLLQKTTHSKYSLLLGYIIWVCKIINNCFRNKSKDTIFFCSRFETAFSCYLISFVKNISYVYVDRDAIHMSYKWNALTKHLLKFIEIKVANNAVAHILPGASRSYSTNRSEYIVNNTPNSNTLDVARNLFKYEYLLKIKGFKVYVNGWLVKSRGLSDILHCAESLPNMKFIVAGKLGCDEASTLIELSNVYFLGSVSNEEALSIYKYVDIVLTLYDTAIDVNRKAEPNKWFDCFAMSVPFITNTGVETAGDYLSDGYCFQYPYGDSHALSQLLTKLQQEPTLLRESRKKLSNKVVESWDVEMINIVKKLTNA